MLAITGATGFVGQAVLAQAGGQPIRALARREQPPRPGVEWMRGDLADKAALDALCKGASAVIHIAGVTNAPDPSGFMAGNVTGTANVLAAAGRASVRRFVHVSSLAAREPALSNYGASKAEAERLVAASPLDWVMVRPPGVYGPGDTDMLPLYRLAARGLGVAPGSGRFSLIHVDDLARLLLALAGGGLSHATLEVDDGEGGHSHPAYARAIASALGRGVTVVPIPAALLGAAATVATAASRAAGRLPKLSRDRARYLVHPDWVAKGGNAAVADIWQPRLGLAPGVADTVAGYRAKGWL